jgi:nickel-dependent lactate racemase
MTYVTTDALTRDDLERIVINTIAALPRVRNVLLVHPDYSRHDFCSSLVPMIYGALCDRGLERLDTLNASGTHRRMTRDELEGKLGVSGSTHPKLGSLYNHEFDNPAALMEAGVIPADFVAEQTKGHLRVPLTVTVNRLVQSGYDAILAVSGTVPHEAIGYSGGTKIFFPGISGPEVIGLLHWAAVLIGIPEIIGTLNNAARDVVDFGTRMIFSLIEGTPIVSFDMVYSENERHEVIANGLFTGVGYDGFRGALREAAELSSRLHIVSVDHETKVAVQRIPEMYDEVWTAGKGSYKLQRPGVIAEGGEVILYAPHIQCFHSNPQMDAEIRQIGYHGRDYVVDYCHRNPGFNKNVASHVINVRGLGSLRGGKEEFPFQVTLATQIPEAECRAVGLGYRDPNSIRREDFEGEGKLWIDEGGQWLYSRSAGAVSSQHGALSEPAVR